MSCSVVKQKSTNKLHAGTDKPDFKNQGEQEDYWAKELFVRDYKVEHYKKYNGALFIKENHYQYGNVILSISANVTLKSILDKGIFYPDIMNQNFRYQPKVLIKIAKDSLKVWKKRYSKKITKDVNAYPKIDSLSIANFKEVNFLENSPKQKRFKFWLFTKGLLNPTYCFIELTNKNANRDTDITLFINGARLTFFQEGWIII